MMTINKSGCLTKMSGGMSTNMLSSADNILKIYLVKDPITSCWVDSKLMHSRHPIACLVLIGDQLTYHTRHQNISMDLESELIQLFESIGWSRAATIEETILISRKTRNYSIDSTETTDDESESRKIRSNSI